MDYKSTLNLPKTDFAMQAGLPKKEPAMLDKWYADHVYETVLEKNEGKPLYVLHAPHMRTATCISARR